MNHTLTANRPQSLSSEHEINDGLAEIELQKLQRQYRIMEGDRKAYSEESRLLISKQRGTIVSLKNENSKLLEELKILELSSQDKARNSFNKLAAIKSEQAEQIQHKIKLILDDVESIDGLIDDVNQKIERKRAMLGGVNAAAENTDAIDKQIKILENRLEKSLVKFNKALSINKKLRGTIDNLRRERLVFNNIYRKLERELLDQKKSMAEIIEVSNSAYEARDEAQAKIIAWREKTEKEHQAYISEIKELDRAFEQGRRLKEFMATKIADHKLNKSIGHKKISSKKATNSSNNNQKSQESLAESLETYEKAFQDIKKVTSTNDIHSLVARFKAVEETNFSLFNFVNEINNEIENLTEEITNIQRKIDQLKVGGLKGEEERKATISTLESSLTKNDEKIKKYEHDYTETIYTINELQKGVESIVKVFETMPLIGAPSATTTESPTESNFIPAELGIGKTAVTDTNLVQFLGVIEQKTNQIMTINYLLSSKKAPVQVEDGVQDTGVLFMPLLGTVGGLLGQGPAAQVGSISIIAPSTGDDHDSDENSDEDERPLSREELKQKTLKGIYKKEKVMANAINVSNGKKNGHKRKVHKNEK